MDKDFGKSYFWILVDLFLVALVVNLVFFVMPTISRYQESLYPTRTLSVSGEGKAFVSPDVAVSSFSVVSRGKNPEDLADTNNQKINAVIQFVKSQGVEAKDIQTTGYNLSPDYKYDETTQRSYITGYTLTQTVTVKMRDLSKVASIIGGLTPLGVNQIGGINFQVDEPDTYLAEARAEAFEKARKKAEEIARSSGVLLGRVVNVGEYGAPIPYYAYGKGGAMMEARDASAIAPPTIEPGTQEIIVNVSVTYSLR